MFWLFGVGAGAFFLAIPRTTVHRGGKGVVVRERWLGGSREEQVASLRPEHVTVAGQTNTDGDLYFVCRLTMPSGRVVTVKEDHRRQVVEEARAMLFRDLVQ
jgi:hypothetical protein